MRSYLIIVTRNTLHVGSPLSFFTVMAAKYPKILNFLKRKAPDDGHEEEQPPRPDQTDSTNDDKEEGPKKLTKVFQTSCIFANKLVYKTCSY